MGIDGDLYRIVLVLHIMAAIVGFGSLVFSGVVGASAASRRDASGAAVAESNYKVLTGFAEWPMYAVPVLGIVLVLMSDDIFKFSQAWVSITFVVYIAFLGILHGAHLPTVRRMNVLMAEIAAGSPSGGVPPQAAELDRLGRKAGAVGAALNVLIVLAVVLMVFKPGL